MGVKPTRWVMTGTGKPLIPTEFEITTPAADEVVVEIAGCGVCHTDLHYREGGINNDFPFLLGHEAAGLVEAVGADVQVVG